MKFAGRRLTNDMNKIFWIATLRILIKSRPMESLRLKNKVLDSAASFSLYSLTCACGTVYIAGMSRRLSKPIR